MDYRNRGAMYARKGDYDRAIPDFEATLRLNPNDQIARTGLDDLKEAQRLKNARDDALAEWMLKELERRMMGALMGGGSSSSSSGSSSGHVFRYTYNVQGSFTATVNGKITPFTVNELVQATSQGDARQQIENAIKNAYPTANNINITRIYQQP